MPLVAMLPLLPLENCSYLSYLMARKSSLCGLINRELLDCNTLDRLRVYQRHPAFKRRKSHSFLSTLAVPSFTLAIISG